MKVTMAGTGYVGLSNAALLKKHFQVVVTEFYHNVNL